jgi:bacterioferritin-associated ferredoxin
MLCVGAVVNELERELLSEARELLEVNSNKPDLIKLDEDTLICECMCISVKDIRDLIKKDEISLSILSKELKLGSGCSSCFKSFNQWKDKI